MQLLVTPRLMFKNLHYIFFIFIYIFSLFFVFFFVRNIRLVYHIKFKKIIFLIQDSERGSFSLCSPAAEKNS